VTAAVDTELAILLDVGSAWVKAAVIGRVRGRWRVAAHAAQPTAWGSTELRAELLEQLAGATDPRLVDGLAERFDGANRIECHTARRPARLALVAVSRELSGSVARRAAEAAGWHVSHQVTLDDGRSLAERLASVQAAEVDAWLVAGGFDGARSPRAMEAAALVASARRAGGQPVIWAGSDELADEVRRLFEPDAVAVVPNARPDARREEPEPLRAELQALLRRTLEGEDTGRMAMVAFPRAIGTLAALGGLRILGVDLGARSAVRAVAEIDGTVATRVHARGGVAGAVFASGAAARIARISVDAGDEASVADLLGNLRARPATVPETAEELAACQAAAVVQMGAMVDDGPPASLDLVIGAGRTIAAAPRPAQAARMLLDGIRPLGVTQLAVDAAGLLGPLGTLPGDEIGEGLTLLGDDLLVPLGTAVVPRGGEPGRVAMRVTVHRPGWPALAQIAVRTGQVQVVPLERGERAELTIELADGVSLGGSRRASRVQTTVSGGSVGLILDARGIPISLPRRGDDRRAVLGSWRDALERDAPRGVERVA
jgi:hypothetical protein